MRGSGFLDSQTGLILDGGVLREQFRGQIGLGNGLIMMGEVISIQTEAANPDLGGFGGEIDDAEGIQH